MGQRSAEHVYNCIPRKDEPRFVLLGRDPHAHQAVAVWANLREQAIVDGTYPESDRAKVAEAREQADVMKAYFEKHRPPPTELPTEPTERRRPKRK